MTIIVYNYKGFYEEIHTERSLCILTLKLKYLLKGYRVFSMPIKLAFLIHKYTGKKVFFTADVFFEKYKPGSDQITYWQPWMNFL